MRQTIFLNGRFLSQKITGVQRYAREFTTCLDRLSRNEADSFADFEFIMLVPQAAEGEVLFANIKIRPSGRWGGNLWEQMALPTAVGRHPLICFGNVAPLATLLSGGPTIVTVHDLSHVYFPSAYRLAFRIWYKAIMPVVFRRAAAIITVSESEKAAILRVFPEAKTKLYAVANGVFGCDVGKVVCARPVDLPRRYVLYVGSLSERKNYRGFIRAMALVAKRMGDMHFVIVGGTGHVFQHSWIAECDALGSKVHQLGQIDHTPLLISIYGGADCLVFPSFYESSGLPPLEAMACGCPVAVSRIPALLERCGDAAEYFDPNSAESIANATLRLLSNGDRRESLIQRGYQQVRRFSWERCVRETVQIIRLTLSRAA